MGTLKHHKRDTNINLVGVSDSNPILNTQQYEVHFDDGTVKEYSSNVIADIIYAQVYDDGN